MTDADPDHDFATTEDMLRAIRAAAQGGRGGDRRARPPDRAAGVGTAGGPARADDDGNPHGAED